MTLEKRGKQFLHSDAALQQEEQKSSEILLAELHPIITVSAGHVPGTKIQSAMLRLISKSEKNVESFGDSTQSSEAS